VSYAVWCSHSAVRSPVRSVSQTGASVEYGIVGAVPGTGDWKSQRLDRFFIFHFDHFSLDFRFSHYSHFPIFNFQGGEL
jgi:hypothetical protein